MCMKDEFPRFVEYDEDSVGYELRGEDNVSWGKFDELIYFGNNGGIIARANVGDPRGPVRIVRAFYNASLLGRVKFSTVAKVHEGLRVAE